MKGMKKIVMVLMVLSMVVVFAAPAFANWYTVSVVTTTIDDGGQVTIRVENVDNSKKNNFVLPADQVNQMLATVLTCQSSGGAMQLQIEADSWNAGTITSMRLLSASP